MRLIKFSVGRVLAFKYPVYEELKDGGKTTKNLIMQKKHPAVIVGDPSKLGRPRFRDSGLFQIVPATSYKDEYIDWVKNKKLYPIIPKRENGFEKDSVILLDQVMTIDLQYFLACKPPQIDVAGYGALNQEEMTVIMDGLKAYYQAQTY